MHILDHSDIQVPQGHTEGVMATLGRGREAPRYVCAYIYIYIYIERETYVCIYIYIYICVAYVYIYIHIYIYREREMYTCVYIYIYTYIHIILGNVERRNAPCILDRSSAPRGGAGPRLKS